MTETKEREHYNSVTTLIYYFDKAIGTYRLFGKSFDKGMVEISEFISTNNLRNDPMNPSVKGLRQVNRLMDKCRQLMLNTIDNTINLKERMEELNYGSSN